MIHDKKQELLTIIMEECAEIQVECSKMIRFDNDSKKLEKEIGDLLCMLEIMYEWNMLNFDEIEKQLPRKRKKLEKWSNLFKGEKYE
jgi:NTP pyrophosphatase (non-canonical NTP hydrolase)